MTGAERKLPRWILSLYNTRSREVTLHIVRGHSHWIYLTESNYTKYRLNCTVYFLEEDDSRFRETYFRNDRVKRETSCYHWLLRDETSVQNVLRFKNKTVASPHWHFFIHENVRLITEVFQQFNATVNAIIIIIIYIHKLRDGTRGLQLERWPRNFFLGVTKEWYTNTFISLTKSLRLN